MDNGKPHKWGEKGSGYNGKRLGGTPRVLARFYFLAYEDNYMCLAL
jgi:hypothetical protein